MWFEANDQPRIALPFPDEVQTDDDFTVGTRMASGGLEQDCGGTLSFATSHRRS